MSPNPTTRMYRMRRPRRQGYFIAEAAAALAVLIPLVVLGAFAAIETCQVFLILAGLNQSAYWAARKIAINYGNNSALAQLPGGPSGYQNAYSSTTFINIVNSSAQFQPPIFDFSSNASRVTVLCQYQSGQHGLAKFPYPDPLQLGRLFSLTSQATVYLEQ